MLNKAIINFFRKKFRPLKAFYTNLRGHINLVKHKRYFKNFRNRPHALKSPLIISITSYPPRFPFLRFTLESIIAQTIKADKILLYVAHEDIQKLPDDIYELQTYGLEIVETENIRSFKKLLPALKDYPDAYIVTVDDDVYYQPKFLEDLLSYHDGSRNSIICHVAHLVTLKNNSYPKEFSDWQHCIKEVNNEEHFVPIGVGGILYSPDALLQPEVFNTNIFEKLCPDTDDFWFYFMGRLNNAKYIKTGYQKYPTPWPKSQSAALGFRNTGYDGGVARNDIQLQNLISEYGNIFREVNHQKN